MVKKLLLSVLLIAFSNVAMCLPYNNNKAMLFVSLGMPKLVLRQYLVQSKQYAIPVVIRGLLGNSYPKTTKRIYEILHPHNKQPIKSGIEIDPIWFRQFNIKVVPALVLNDGSQSCVIYGNLKLPKLLEIIKNNCNSEKLKHLAIHYLENGNA